MMRPGNYRWLSRADDLEDWLAEQSWNERMINLADVERRVHGHIEFCDAITKYDLLQRWDKRPEYVMAYLETIHRRERLVELQKAIAKWRLGGQFIDC